MYINLFDFSKFDNCPALISDSETVTYNQMNLIAESFSRIFVGKNLILQICTNTIGSIVGYTSFIGLQQVPLLLDLHIKKDAVDELCTRYRPEYIYLPDYMISDYCDLIVIKRVYNYLLLKLYKAPNIPALF